MATAQCIVREHIPSINYKRLQYEITYKNSNEVKNVTLSLIKCVMMSVSPRLLAYISYGNSNKQLYNAGLFYPPISLQPCYQSDTLRVLFPGDFQASANTKLMFDKPAGETASMQHIRLQDSPNTKLMMPDVPIDGFTPSVRIVVRDIVAKPIINESKYIKYSPWQVLKDNHNDNHYVKGMMARHTVIQIPCVIKSDDESSVIFKFGFQGSQDVMKQITYCDEYIMSEFKIVVAALKGKSPEIDAPDGNAEMHIDKILQYYIMIELGIAIIIRIHDKKIAVEVPNNSDDDIYGRIANLTENRIIPDIKKIMNEFAWLVRGSRYNILRGNPNVIVVFYDGKIGNTKQNINHAISSIFASSDQVVEITKSGSQLPFKDVNFDRHRVVLINIPTKCSDIQCANFLFVNKIASSIGFTVRSDNAYHDYYYKWRGVMIITTNDKKTVACINEHARCVNLYA